MQQLGLWGGFTAPPGTLSGDCRASRPPVSTPAEKPQETEAFEMKRKEVAILAEACMRLLELAVNQADQSKETDAVSLEEVYNELKPQLEQLLRSSEHGHSTSQTIRKPEPET